MLQGFVVRQDNRTLINNCVRFKNFWTHNPLKKETRKKPQKYDCLGNKVLSENGDDFPSKPIQHSKSPYTKEHPKGIPESFLAANKLKDNEGAFKKRVILGRGNGSGKGKTAGRGTKGQKSRSGTNILF